MRPEEVPQAIQEAFEADRVEVTRHFWDELRADALMLADIRCALAEISNVRDMGQDRLGNPKYEVTGLPLSGREISIICSFKETGALLLITVYEGRQS